MKKTIIKKEFYREIHKTRNRFLSILLMVALGVAFYAGVRSTEPDMIYSADCYYDDTHLVDLRVLGTLGMTQEDVDAIAALPQVSKAEGTFQADLNGTCGDQEYSMKVMGIVDGINEPVVTAGRMPSGPGECLLDAQLAVGEVGIGSTFLLSAGKEEEDIADTLGVKEVKVVGLGNYPYYLAYGRGSSAIGDGSVDGFLLVTEDSFSLSVYTEVLVMLQGGEELNSYGKSYEALSDAGQDALEAIEEERCKIRLASIREEGEETLAEAREDLEEAQKEAKEKLQDAKDQIQEAEKDLAEGKETLESNKKKIQEAKDTIKTQEKELAQGKAQYEQGRKDWEKAQEELEKTALALETSQKTLEEGEEKLAQGKAAYEEAYANLLSGGMGEEQAKAALGETKATLDATEASLLKGQQELQEGQAAYAKGVAQSKAAQAILKETKAKLSQGEKAMEQGKKDLAEAEEKIKTGEEELKDGEEEVADAKEKYQEAEAETQEKIQDAQQKIQEGEEDLEAIEMPEWILLDRSMIQTIEEYQDDSKRIGAIGKVFPVIFFLVAALVSLTTMTRMVEEERTQIGVLKALGYSPGTIAWKYVKYALWASVGGCVLGAAIGEVLLPSVIIRAYQMLYDSLPYVYTPFHWGHALTASLAAIGCTLGATVFACYREFRAQPADLMRPEPPKNGKRIFLERIGFLWKPLSFTKKAAIRNLFRYKKRFFMTVLGIGGCMGLLLTGFGLKDSIFSISNHQYKNILVYDTFVSVKEDASPLEREELERTLGEYPGVVDWLHAAQETKDVLAGKTKKSITIFVMEEKENQEDFVILQNRKTKEKLLPREEGVYLSEKLAHILSLKEGDTMEIYTDDVHSKTVTVRGIAENYLYHYVYMTPGVYEEVFGKAPEYNEIYLKNESRDPEWQDGLSRKLLEEKAVMGLRQVSEFQQMVDDILQNLNVIVYVIIISAGLLAFVVLYNLNNINIAERKRELATLKVLGFFDQEVASYVYRENVMLTCMGAFLGIFFGLGLHQYVTRTAEIDAMMFGRQISFISFLWSVLLTFVFAAIVNGITYYKLKKIDMVESMKSVE